MGVATEVQAPIPGRRPRWGIAIRVIFLATIAAASVAVVYLALSSAQDARRRARSMEKLKRIALANYDYEKAHGRLPGYARAGNKTPLLSWRVALLPYLDEGALYEQFRLDEPWDGPHNKPLLGRMPAVFALPDSGAAPGMTFYRSFSGPGTLFDPADEEAPGLAEITKGLSQTIAVIEAREAVPWTRPDSEVPIGGEGLLRRIGGHHPGGTNALFVDGSVKFLKESIADHDLRALVSRDGDVSRVPESMDLVTPIRTADRLVAYEGLPRAGAQGERGDQTRVNLEGFRFYATPLAISAEDERALRSVLGNERSYRLWGGGKFCGGFHPDYLAEWHRGGAVYRVLICFGCNEAEVIGPGGRQRFDLTDDAVKNLREVFSRFRAESPAPKVGLSPLGPAGPESLGIDRPS